MELDQSTLQRTFTVKHNGKSYHVDYLNSDGQILGLLNRNYWEVSDEEGEEIDIYKFRSQGNTKKEKEQIKQNRKLVEKLINFCIKHFDNYKPKSI